MPENVQPINYCIKWSRILFNIAHVNHYVLLLMIWDFDLEFSIFLTFSYFWAFTLVSIKKIVSFTFLRYFNLKVEYKGVLSIFLFSLVWSRCIPYLTWCKSRTRTPGPGTREPPQNLKVGPGIPLKFKSGTPGPPSKFKSGTPSPSFNEFIFFKNINCE